jgi:hypothetical protein
MSARPEWNWQAVPLELAEHLRSQEQRDVFELLTSGMPAAHVGKARGTADRTTAMAVKKIKENIRAAGYDPLNGMTLVSPRPQALKGRSALVKVGEDGSETTVMYWNKTDYKRESHLAAFQSAIEDLSKGIKPFTKVTKPTKAFGDLLTVYTLTDFHLGMYSWADETGSSWDMKIAENVLLNAFAEMMAGSPDSKVGVFAQLGDLLHWDGLLALTPTAKNVLDADTRFPLLVQTAIGVCLKAVEMLLHKHEKVHVLMCEGNHDIASSVWLRAIMANTFRDNPRVTVDDSPFPFYFYRWGKTFIGWHHGHLQKMDQLPLLFASDPKFRSEYGQCVYTYIHTGHMHHQKVIDKGGILVEQHPTLSARDAHGARGFLFSNREAKAITYHKDKGERSRCTVRPDPSEFKGAA